jgi:hypothetical protein
MKARFAVFHVANGVFIVWLACSSCKIHIGDILILSFRFHGYFEKFTLKNVVLSPTNFFLLMHGTLLLNY